MIEKEGFAALVLRLRAEGISDLDLLTAVEQTQRSRFVPAQFVDQAYSSRTIPIDCGSFMEGADLAVRILHKLNVKPGHRVLEIGTGSGFMTTVLGRLAERVLSLDRFSTLIAAAQRRLDEHGLRNVVLRQADGSSGVPGEGTFDRIVATAGFSQMPRFLAEQMVSGGVAVVPVAVEEGRYVMVRLTKTGSRFEREDFFETPYLPLESRVAQSL
ncbi:protein-L-isoaspartate(D-aspartate) O-methyltransferase [Ciceribacter sp. L1K22]|uniref:protein-L-isoaspartate(D-aspartate) O-methyltransferase n=1 Tax=Ciceribacter sp. L1K22 TaxID=2820275 RepID=UPI001ABDCB8E|nr:protein-L-isoaspartate(D-aspartate) O-methyltransferase [Ciceribacter sp. L1K22]MBO3760068.1 protein-L-isoaspartate(D-aspartate) O-methyltransferase [Ciceribacter sp. L1K22]